jgi:hypothetical protein
MRMGKELNFNTRLWGHFAWRAKEAFKEVGRGCAAKTGKIISPTLVNSMSRPAAARPRSFLTRCDWRTEWSAARLANDHGR